MEQSPFMRVFKIYPAEYFFILNSEHNFSFNFAARKKNFGPDSILIMKVAVSSDDLYPHERWILGNLLTPTTIKTYVSSNGVPYVQKFLETEGCHFYAMLSVAKYDLKIPEASDTVKIRELVKVFWEVVRIDLMLMSFDIIVFISFGYFQEQNFGLPASEMRHSWGCTGREYCCESWWENIFDRFV